MLSPYRNNGDNGDNGDKHYLGLFGIISCPISWVVLDVIA
jgi:hypothetical protein